MKLSIGYYHEDEYERPFAASIGDCAAAIGEVYFPWPGLRTCRAELDEGAQGDLVAGLRAAKDMGASLCLLANANCYGGDALSGALAHRLEGALDALSQWDLIPQALTTTSLYVAHVVKRMAPALEVRASVNMNLGTYWQMDKLFDLFDGFYLAREYNYRLDHIAGLKSALAARGKGLYLLANSGCMSHCPGHTFHDNLVAHESEVAQAGNPANFSPYVCWRHYQDPANFSDLIKNSWIMPRDLYRYEGLFDTVKLATRMHQRPYRVIDAYARGQYRGNPLELTEPCHAPLLFPGTLDGEALPADFFARKAACDHQCQTCGFCEGAWAAAYRP